MRPLFVGFEPWETLLGISLLESLSVDINVEDTMVLVADPYQVTNKFAALMLKQASKNQGLIDIVFRDLATWQTQIKHANGSNVESRWQIIDQQFDPGRLELCMSSDVVLFPRERTPYYPKLTPAQRKQAALLVFGKVLESFSRFRPDVVIMIGDQYSVKNFIALLCEKHSIPIRVIRHSRFEDFYKCDAFFFPQTPIRGSISVRNEESRRVEGGYGDFLYKKNLAVGDVARLRSALEKPFSYSVAVVRDTIKNILVGQREHLKSVIARLTLKPMDFSRVKFWRSSKIRVFVFEWLVMWRKLEYFKGKSFVRDIADLPERFVLVPLHYRPESSTLTQGFGVDDEGLVKETALILKDICPDMVCFVLENPSMIGLRTPAFYEGLKKFENVRIGDPVLDTKTLVGRSSAVLTVSGTAALEASLQDVPVFVAGRPDFLTAINPNGHKDLSVFLASVVEGRAESSRDLTLKYQSWIKSNGHRGSLGWESIRKRKANLESIQLIRSVLSTPLPADGIAFDSGQEDNFS